MRPKLKASDGSSVTIRTGTAENFLRAVEDVRGGKMGFCKAGKVYGVNHATLQKFYKAMGYHARNRSNNPNFSRSASASDGDADADSGDGDGDGFPRDPSRFGAYTPPRAFYQHFMSPLTPPAAAAAASSSAWSDPAKAAAAAAAPPPPDSVTSKLEAYTAGRLLNYASLYCEAIGVSDDAEKETAPVQAAAQPHPQPQPPPQPQPQPSEGADHQQNLDMNHPIVLCNL